MRPFQRTIQFHASGCVDTVAPARPALVSWREGGELSCGGHHHHHLHQRGWRHPLSRLHTNRFRQRVTLCLQVNKQLFLARFTLKQATISWLLEDLLVISCKQILICFCLKTYHFRPSWHLETSSAVWVLVFRQTDVSPLIFIHASNCW